jgi:hypothetical protein
MRVVTRRLLNAALGGALGVITAPLALIAWPAFAAWFMWNETEEDAQ